MNRTQLNAVYEKTQGHCHFCGDPIDLKKYGSAGQNFLGAWEIDHVTQRAKGGQSTPINYLPACVPCNRLRWHRTGAALRELLLLGIIARGEIDQLSPTGKEMVLARARYLERRAQRSGRKGPGPDPVLKEMVDREDRQILIGFLRLHPGREFTPLELTRRTGVPKSMVRQLLETSRNVKMRRQGRLLVFEAKLPKRYSDLRR